MTLSRAVTAGAAVALLIGVTGCGGEAPAPDDDASVSVTTVTTESSAGADAALVVCQQVITSAGVMVRDFNTFMAALNRTQDYSRIGTEQRYARETLDTGAKLIRASLTAQVPADIDDKTQAFLTATEQLSEQISDERKLALNRATADWSEKRTELIDACGEFMPTGG